LKGGLLSNKNFTVQLFFYDEELHSPVLGSAFFSFVVGNWF
jgi:hypothetical protein